MTIRAAIVGCGLVGRKRANALGAQVAACVDIDLERARSLANQHGADASADWREVVLRQNIDVVFVATINGLLAEICTAALEAGKHVLVEKPAARNVLELDAVIEAQHRSGKLVRVGFNHRYHPALLKARQLFEDGVLGEMMFVRGRYGHGGRLGYEQEWRADPARSGGGELIDQGVHLIDLARLFLGDFTDIMGEATTFFWKMPVDDNAFLHLRTGTGRTAFLHASCTEWKNLFSLEIYGALGKLHVEGLGGSYGLERLTWYRMLPEMGPPETTAWEYPGADTSWDVETTEFLEDIRLGRAPAAGLVDARAALVVVDRIYRQSGHELR
ncbi:MAG TPA: Gfo/Idh/MocA family oxidoreductase [Thermoanaerobaculia bacterium]|jgi:predicted dehydrogenase|nr:Gfo/Idh/MocA family oxidoreductase [Thermoanaerobaculia bacterium]